MTDGVYPYGIAVMHLIANKLQYKNILELLKIKELNIRLKKKSFRIYYVDLVLMIRPITSYFWRYICLLFPSNKTKRIYYFYTEALICFISNKLTDIQLSSHVSILLNVLCRTTFNTS